MRSLSSFCLSLRGSCGSFFLNQGLPRAFTVSFLENLPWAWVQKAFGANGFLEAYPDLVAELLRLLTLPIPASFEDDPICPGVRGAFTRWKTCGVLLHVSCFTNIATDDASFKCPGCLKNEKVVEAEPLVATNRCEFSTGILSVPRVGYENGLDRRASRNLDDRLTDEQAVGAGFRDAQDWITRSMGGTLISPASIEGRLKTLPEHPAEDGGSGNMYSMQW